MMMKTTLTLLMLSALSAFGQLRTNVILEWTYPPAELTNVTFLLFSSQTITNPVENWPLLWTVRGTTNAPTPTNLTLAMEPQVMFFAMKSSNFWGRSTNFSNVAWTPAPPRSDSTLLAK